MILAPARDFVNTMALSRGRSLRVPPFHLDRELEKRGIG